MAGPDPSPARGSRTLMAACCLTLACLAASAGGRAATSPPESSSHQRMVEMLQEIADHPPDDHIAFPQKKVQDLRAALERQDLTVGTESPVPHAVATWKILFELGQAEVRLGRAAAGIDTLQQAYALLDQLEKGTFGPIPRAQLASHRLETRFQLGVACMRLGEDQNCCQQENGEACLLPLRGGGIHKRQEAARLAMKYFLEILDSPLPEGIVTEAPGMNAAGPSGGWQIGVPGASPVVRYQQSARWLLNIAAMTIGRWPDEVPRRHRVPPETFKSEIPFPRFENVAPKLGLDTFDLSGGVIVDDFDNDGLLDIATSTWDIADHMRLFHNNGDGTFDNLTEQANLSHMYGGLNMVQADYDNDGDTDIYVIRGAWLYTYGRHPDSLLSNNGDGTFTDRTLEAGLAEVNYPAKAASWGDYDNDGDLDLFIANETSRDVKAPTQLFRNNGDGTFTDVAPQSAAQGHCFGMGTVWGDYDNDRNPDLFISGCLPHALLHNNGDLTFTNVAKDLGIDAPKLMFPTWWWDYDNDGALDLFVGATSGSVGVLALNPLGVSVPSSEPQLRALQESVKVELMSLYRNDGHGGFRDVAREVGLTYPAQPMGGNFGDLDNDGYLDFYLGTGDVFYSELTPNVMFLNQGGKRFVNVTMAGGFGHLQKGHGIAFADLDEDGDQDVYAQMGGAFPGDRFFDALFENPGFGNHWLTIRVAGRQSNRSAIGARLHARILEKGQERSVYRHVNSGGSFGCNPLRQTIGLGRAERLLSLEIFWPTTGRTQRFTDVPMDRSIRIIEDEERYEVLPARRPIHLGRR